jgi:hypothetical protein
MKKSRIFMAVGAFALVIAGVFATKANKKATLFTFYYLNGSLQPIGAACNNLAAFTAMFTTSNPGGLITATFTSFPLYSANGGSPVLLYVK